MRKIEVKIRQVIWTLTESFKPNTAYPVMYKGFEYFIKSSLTGHDIWNLHEIGEKKPSHYRINGSELKVLYSIDRFKRVFKEKLRFQKSNWQAIDCLAPMFTRLSYMNSDNIYFRK